MVRVYLRLCESEIDITSRLVHRKSNLMFTLSSNKGQRKKFAFALAFVRCKWTLIIVCTFLSFTVLCADLVYPSER